MRVNLDILFAEQGRHTQSKGGQGIQRHTQALIQAHTHTQIHTRTHRDTHSVSKTRTDAAQL